jgi:AcrR family transcriptional regulator
MAGTSVSAANYHFGSKEELLRAALLLRAAPLNVLRLKALALVEAGPSEGKMRVRAILEAFIRPFYEVRPELKDEGQPGRKLAARLYVDPPDVVKAIQQEAFGSVTLRFRKALEKAIVDVDPEKLDLGLQMSLGVVVHSISGRFLWPDEAEDPSGSKREQVIENLVAFAAAGLLALVEEESSELGNPGVSSQ